MKCIKCGIFLPRTTDFFFADYDNFKRSRPGHESLRNDPTFPCKTCKSALTKCNKQTKKECYIIGLRANHPTLTKLWFDETLAKQNNRGLITNILMNLTSNLINNRIGVHRYDNNIEHEKKIAF